MAPLHCGAELQAMDNYGASEVSVDRVVEMVIISVQ